MAQQKSSACEKPTEPVPGDSRYTRELGEYIDTSHLSNVEKFENFAKYTPRWSIMRFLIRYELFKKILEVEGSIVEAGVQHGGGLMTWAQLSAILEPYNHQRRIIGFDTFEGFIALTSEDGAEDSRFKTKGTFGSDSFDDIIRCSQIHDITRPMGQVPKVHLVKGDILQGSIEKYLEKHPYLVISLLHLDVNLYAPTKRTLEVLAPRVVKGGIIVFDQINSQGYPGETIAVNEVLGISNLKIKRFGFGTSITYAVRE